MRMDTHLLRSAAPVAGLLLASLALALPASAETAGKDHGYQILHTFNGSDGTSPWDTLAEDGKGNFVGTTYGGGANGLGTVYKITSDGTFISLYSFQGGQNDGAGPVSLPRLTVDKAGNIYGTTSKGGYQCASGYTTCGTIFEIASSGSESVLYDFTGGADGYDPEGTVTLEKKTGSLYGTTSTGGTDGVFGSIFKLASDGTFTVISNGTGSANALIEDKEDNIYGAAPEGGSAGGWGIVFKFAPSGQETQMYSFFGRDDGGAPSSALVRDKAGNLYGTTSIDGADGGGTIYKIAPNGLETTLYSFPGNITTEADPGTLVMDRHGNLYGTARNWGTSNDGYVFEFTSAGTFVTLYNFAGGSDGANPNAGLTLVGNELYGTTMAGGGTGCGGKGCGTVFRIKK